MVELAILIGIFSYLVLGLGLLGLLEQTKILGILGLAGIIFLTVYLRKRIFLFLKDFWENLKKDKVFLLLFFLLFLQILINFIGALGPELGFDSLWYHLTIPKIFLQQGRIFYIPGGLFYYSTMPKLLEMLYLATLPFSSLGILAKIIHFFFGVLSVFALYNLVKRYLSPRLAILSAVIFYSTLIVGWMSITAYVDLGRTFFEILALDLFLQWSQSNEKEKFSSKLVDSAVLLGLAISTKLISLASLPIYLIIILLRTKKIKLLLKFSLISLLIPLPWFVFSFLHTGNPFYPVFSGILDISHKIVTPNLFVFLKDVFLIFFNSQDPISAVFLIFIPLIILIFFQKRKVIQEKIGNAMHYQSFLTLRLFVLLSLLFWFLTPRTGGSRFILPYLPAVSFLLVWVVVLNRVFYQKILYLITAVICFVNLGYRGLANAKFIKVLVKRETVQSFLERRLNFKNDEFFDVNNDLSKIILKDDLVIIYGSHNLFYADFPIIHESFAKKGVYFSYLLTQNTNLPEKYHYLKKVYYNQKSGVSLYLFGQKWE